MIIGLSGYAQTGKDTVAGFLEDAGFVKVAFADKLREAMYALNPIVGMTIDYEDDGTVTAMVTRRYAELIDEWGYERAKTEVPEIRQLLQRLGTEVGRKVLGEDVWVDALLNSFERDDEFVEPNYVITDMRFPNEWAAVRRAGGSTVRVERPGTGPVNDHPSEISLDGFSFDYVIVNNGTLEDLEAKVKELFL